MHVVAVLFAALIAYSNSMQVFVSTTGKATGSGTEQDPVDTLQAAQALIASQRKDNTTAIVTIEEGIYIQSNTWQLTDEDSNTIWQAATGATVIVSGGKPLALTLTTIKPYAGRVGMVHVSSSMLQNRHLFVNNQRAARTSYNTSMVNALFQGATLVTDGIVVNSNLPLTWPAQGYGVEFAWPQSTSPWTEPRCAVLNVTQQGGQVLISMQQPCWYNLLHKPCGQVAKDPPSVVENVGLAAMNQPNQFWLDTEQRVLYYSLEPQHEPSSMDVRWPQVEVLLRAYGTTKPLSNLRFENLLFQHATWLRPGQGDGYVEQQSGSCIIGSNPNNSNCDDDFLWIKSPGNLQFSFTRDVALVGCEVAYMGGVGVDFGNGTHRAVVQGSYVHDISGSGVQIGSFNSSQIRDEERQDLNNTVNNTLITLAAVEFHGAVAINVGYSKGTAILHNEMSNLTYSGMSMGWGWARENDSYASNNVIAYNRIHHYKTMLNDGGGIYLLGPQNGTIIHHNFVSDQITSSSGALYPDEGSAYEEWYENVVTNIGKSEWLHLWTASIHNISVHNNYADTHTFENHGTNCPMANNTIFPPGQPPAAAQAIMAAAGMLPNSNRFV
eukprot:m.48706 g.48706  ORF g.48706 m.48706 type:complete len:608 (+) comp13310_c0_seq3:101-1924(+)